MTLAKETQTAKTAAKAHPILRKGSTGDDVKYIQNTLNYIYGPDLKVDGIFGSKTEAAVKQFQEDYGLVVDGIVGIQTWYYLVEARHAPISPKFPLLRKGSTGDDVKKLQHFLNCFSYDLVVDGIFGHKTEAAVKDFQARNGLVVDGIVGPQTWSALHQYAYC